MLVATGFSSDGIGQDGASLIEHNVLTNQANGAPPTVSQAEVSIMLDIYPLDQSMPPQYFRIYDERFVLPTDGVAMYSYVIQINKADENEEVLLVVARNAEDDDDSSGGGIDNEMYAYRLKITLNENHSAVESYNGRVREVY